MFLKQIYLNIFILTAVQENSACLHSLHSSDVLLLLLLLITAAITGGDSRRQCTGTASHPLLEETMPAPGRL